MKLPVAPFQRIAFGVAFCSLAAVGAGAIALVTQPAASSADPVSQQVTYLDPAADEVTTTTTGPTPVTMAQETLGDAPADRAEKAAVRAEVAADRSEVAATRTETIITATTVAPTTTTTVAGRPILVDVTQPTIPATTTTMIPLPKSWVVVARFPVGTASTSQPPTLVGVELQTGQLRVSGLLPGGSGLRSYQSAVWFADDEQSKTVGSTANPPTAENTGTMIEDTQKTTPDHIWRGIWPTGPHTIAAGTYTGNGWVAPYGQAGEILVEEYR